MTRRPGVRLANKVESTLIYAYSAAGSRVSPEILTGVTALTPASGTAPCPATPPHHVPSSRSRPLALVRTALLSASLGPVLGRSDGVRSNDHLRGPGAHHNLRTTTRRPRGGRRCIRPHEWAADRRDQGHCPSQLKRHDGYLFRHHTREHGRR